MAWRLSFPTEIYAFVSAVLDLLVSFSCITQMLQAFNNFTDGKVSPYLKKNYKKAGTKVAEVHFCDDLDLDMQNQLFLMRL